MSDEHTESAPTSAPTLDGLFNLMETIRTEVRQIAERQEILGKEVSDILKRTRRIDLKAGTISGDMMEIRSVLREHEAQLLSLIPE